MTDEKFKEVRTKMTKEWDENKPITHRQLSAYTDLILNEVIAPLKAKIHALEREIMKDNK